VALPVYEANSITKFIRQKANSTIQFIRLEGLVSERGNTLSLWMQLMLTTNWAML